MAYKYYRYTVEGPLLSRDAARALGEAGGTIVRVDNRDGRTEVTVAITEEGTLPAGTALGAGAEVCGGDVLTFGG
jgi:translation initiation factor IF-2